MGPVGAPEIPTRTGHNARLKVGFTTDRQDPDGWNHVQQGRIVTSPGLPPASPRAHLSSSRPTIFCPYHTAARISSTLLVSFARPPLFIRPRPPPRCPPATAILAILLLPSASLLSRPPSPRARARYAPHQWQDRVLVLRRPAFLRIARMPRHSVA